MYYKGRKVKQLGRDLSDIHGFGPRIRAELAARLPRGRATRALDVGTGSAMTTAFLARTLPEGSRVWTLDPSSEALRGARASLKAEGLESRVEFVRGSADRLEMADGFFDVAVSVMVMHHLEDAGRALCEVSRVVARPGMILIADYAPAAADELVFRAEHKRQDFLPVSEATRCLRECGFQAEAAGFGLWYMVDARR
jgi:ubiquinone/menaquinone biosynthesis C-methylase UbiE